ncbi:hypothetical protein K502DRAFT_292471 [Neoconidiobolus thromboides FSU 785]|nr:hypothetical protein K502DRAFT_292471 [Neoconidiobolus thromboides FSU 785]
MSIPAVLIGTMLNVLDAVSFGIIIFPTALPMFSDFGPDGISMFLVSTVIAQLIYASGGSRFGGGNGGFMIEVVPFLHIICNIILNDLGEAGKQYVIPTVMVAYALSTIVTGIVFLGLGWYKLGSLMEFFPRHILIGCIGGVGVFLLATAMELTTKLSPTFDWSIWASYFSVELLPLWTSSLVLSLILQIATRIIKHPLVTPCFFFLIPIVFYMFVFLLNGNLNTLRQIGWLFPLPTPIKPFYDFYLNFNIYLISWSTLPKVIPAIFALTFFGILHVPINVPALAVSTRIQDIDVNRELVGHGISNLTSGLFGSVQNYLIYSNSVIFIRSGGGSRVAGLLLALCTFIILLLGPSIVGFIPTPLVGALIFHMGIELIKEAVYDTYTIVHPLEYITIVLIVLTMGFVGFIEGIFFGIVLACMFFVLIYSHRSPIKTISDGTCVTSTVRRLYHQRTFLETVGNQVKLITLQGFMFFGTIHQLDHSISQILKGHRHRTAPIRFIILDFTLVGGIDFSATDAFSRILYRLSSNSIYLVISGVTLDSDTGSALRKAGIWSSNNEGYVKYFEKCNQALEWCENTLLSNFYQLAKQNNQVSSRLSTHLGTSGTYPLLEADYSSSPRNRQIEEAAIKVYSQIHETSSLIKNARQPLGLLLQAFQEIEDVNYPSLHQLAQYFEKVEYNFNDILWKSGDKPDAIYILENGLLRVKIPTMDPSTQSLVEYTMESILPGTFVGEVTFLTHYMRTATVYTDSEKATLWKLSLETYHQILEMGSKNPNSPEATIPYMLTKLALTYSAYDNKLYSTMAMI